MQILSSGSFVKLENKEKIENLIFTAKEMANAANETDGFVNETENNKRLALEIWQGAEYMTLDHEEAQVENLFVGNFLDRLREIGGARAAETVSQNVVSKVETTNTTSEIEPPKDEFLGLVSTDEIEETSADVIADSIAARESQTDEIAISAHDDLAEDVGTGAAEIVESAQESTATTDEATADEIETAKEESETIVETTETSESASSGEKQTESDSGAAKVPGAIVLPEKEPYRWEKCTVTATIQLFPTADDSGTQRKAVLSVRTHDFAPQFSIVELTGDGEALLSEILPALGRSFEKYKTDLPLKVMDKMKKEKSVPKKQISKTTIAAATSAAKTPATNSQPKPITNKTEKAVVKPESAKPATAIIATAPKSAAVAVPVESGQQGSLFNF